MTQLYWVGNGGNYDDTGHWSISSGGGGGHAVPTSADDVAFDANSFSSASQQVLIRNGHTNNAHNFDMSAVTNNPALIFFSGSVGATTQLNVYQDFNIPSSVSTGINLASGASAIIDFQGAGGQGINVTNPVSRDITWQHDGSGTFNMNANLDIGPFVQTAGTLTTNNHTLGLRSVTGGGNCAIIYEGSTLNFGSSVVSLGGGTFQMGVGGGGHVTLNAGTSTVKFIAGSTIQILNGAFTSATLTFHDIWINNTSSNSLQTTSTGATFNINNLTIDPGATINFRFGTFALNGTFTANGTSTQHIGLLSTTGGQSWFVSSTSSVSVQWCTVQDSHASGTTPFVAIDSFDGGNNVNWSIFNPAVYAIFTNLVHPPLENVAIFTAMDLAEYIVNIDNITFNSARIQCYTPLLGGGQTYGFVYGTSPTPIVGVDNSKDLTGNNGISFTTLLGLGTGQVYYVRMYVDTAGVYQYGLTHTFTTSAIVPIGVITTDNLVSKYQFLLFDDSGNLIADLGGYISNRMFSITRNRPEEISFSIPLFTLDQLAEQLQLDPSDFFQAGIQEILIRRDSVPICAGQIDYWESNFSDPANPVINVKAHGWMSLFSYRTITETYNGDDASFIIRDLITSSQAGPNADFGITLGTAVAGSNTYAQKIFQNKKMSDIMLEMSEEDGGFDFQFTYDKIFNLFLPSQGITRNDILFTYPGNMTDIKVSVDSTKIVNDLLARGTGVGTNAISTNVTDSGSQATYKLRQGIKDFPDMDIDQLTNSANSEINYYKIPLVLNSITYNGLQANTPIVGSFSVGDKIRVYAPSLPLPVAQLTQPFMIDSITVTLDKDDVENVQLALAVPS